MVPIGPKKGGGFVVVPLNYGAPQTSRRMFEDKSGTMDSMVTKDRSWRTDNNNGYTERIYSTLKNSCLNQKGYNVRMRQPNNYSQSSMAKTLDVTSRAETRTQAMTIQVNDDAEFSNFEQCPVISRRPAKTPMDQRNNPYNNMSLVHRLNRQL